VTESKPTARDALWELVNWHQRLRPRLEVQDVYKLLYQSVFGVGHIIRSGGQALECLRRELEDIDLRVQPDEEMIENISLDGKTARVNLRPFKRREMDAAKLFEAMRLSADRNRGTPQLFQKLWRDFGSLVASGAFGFDPKMFKEFEKFARMNKYPVVHHSRTYVKLYVPSYRVTEMALYREAFGEPDNIA